MITLLLTRGGLSLTAAMLVVASCASAPPRGEVSPSHAPATWTDAGGHRNGRLAIDGTWIHYVDYGGAGRPLVFLAGLGNTAHVFDDFAPRFTDAFRVIAVTRRGYGESGRPAKGFDTQRLTEDVRAVLDSLRLERVILAGHSVAGDELTAFAARYPDRTSAVVYLEAAYDRSGMSGRLVKLGLTKQLPPAPPHADEKDRGSIGAYRAYLTRQYGVEWPESEVRATHVFDGGGRYVRDASGPATNWKILRGESSLAYDRVVAPVLAMYAVDREIERDYPWMKQMTIGRGAAEQQAERAQRAEREWEAEERNRLRTALPRVRIVEIRNASHFVFISHADLVEREIRAFVTGGS